MELGPIWRAMMRNKSSYILIALQIAVTMAIMVNAIGIIQDRSKMMARPSGIDEQNIFYLSSLVYDPNVDPKSVITEDLDAIRHFPGVRDAIVTNTVPLSGGGWSEGITLNPDPNEDATGVAIFFSDDLSISIRPSSRLTGVRWMAETRLEHSFESIRIRGRARMSSARSMVSSLKCS